MPRGVHAIFRARVKQEYRASPQRPAISRAMSRSVSVIRFGDYSQREHWREHARRAAKRGAQREASRESI